MDDKIMDALKSITEAIGTAFSPLPKIWRDGTPPRFWVAYSDGSVDSYVTTPEAEKYCKKHNCIVVESYEIMRFTIKKK